MKKKKCLLDSLIIYFFILLMLYLTSMGLDHKDIGLNIRQAIPVALGVYLLEWLMGQSIFSLLWWSQWLTALSWVLVLPGLAYYENYAVGGMISNYADILFGMYLLVLLIALQYMFTVIRPQRILRFILVILQLGLLMMPGVQLIHYLIYGHCLSDASVMAVQQTNLQEAWEWVLSYVGIGWLSIIVCLLLLLGTGFYRNRCPASQLIEKEGDFAHRWGILLICLPLCFYLPGKLFHHTEVAASWHRVSQYRMAEQRFMDTYAERYASLQLMEEQTLAQREPGTVIVVIGESASRNYMKAYTPSVEYEDTPWLTERRGKKDFVVFDHAYSCYNQTAEVLLRALTEKSQYNQKEFNESISLIDIAKRAGYETYWYTNQSGMGRDDAPMTLIAKTADHMGTPASDGSRKIYDGDLIALLENLDPSKPNFVVLHIIGSHSRYEYRCPPECRQWDDGTPEGAYANALLYTDHFLQQVFSYARNNLNLQVMVYFSDHGENVYKGHHPEIRTFDNVRIPMFVYLSPSYQKDFPGKAAALRMHQKEYFSNDMIYNTIEGILDAESNHYDEREDFSSLKYAFDKSNVMTFLGTVHVSADDTIEE